VAFLEIQSDESILYYRANPSVLMKTVHSMVKYGEQFTEDVLIQFMNVFLLSFGREVVPEGSNGRCHVTKRITVHPEVFVPVRMSNIFQRVGIQCLYSDEKKILQTLHGIIYRIDP
jgi:hypothetical protein